MERKKKFRVFYFFDLYFIQRLELLKFLRKASGIGGIKVINRLLIVLRHSMVQTCIIIVFGKHFFSTVTPKSILIEQL
jgi:hypothetical protein